MAAPHLHIVSFDVPYPPNYGGVIDVFYKIKALHEEGVKIHLHCFEYGRAEARVLESLTENVYYYKRRMSRRFLFNSLPYIVVTRSSEKLMEHLLRDNYPILFEGLHSCYHLSDPRLSDRRKLVRTHNIEHDYYNSLAEVETEIFRKAYFRMEARKLRHFEPVLKRANHILAISRPDQEELTKRYKHVVHVSAFHSYDKVRIQEGMGKFALYHGNLEVGENNQAALYLAEKVFAGSDIPFLIAGKNPSAELKSFCSGQKNITLKGNIPTQEIDALIREAQINILPTFQATGIKLKLLAALFNGRHCIVNTPMVANTGLEALCTVADDPSEMRKEVENLFRKSFGNEEKEKREHLLCPAFSNKENAAKILPLI